MKTIKTKVFDVEVELEVPATVAEYIQLAGSEQILLNTANRYTLAHIWAGDARSAVVEALEEKTKIAQLVVKEIPATKEGGNPTKIYEKDSVYIERVKAESNLSSDDFSTIVTDAVADIAFNPGPSERTTATKKEYFNMADSVLSAGKSGNPTPSGLVGKEVFDKVATGLEASNPGLSIKRADDALGTPDRDSLAQAFRTNDERVKREAHAQLAL